MRRTRGELIAPLEYTGKVQKKWVHQKLEKNGGGKGNREKKGKEFDGKTRPDTYWGAAQSNDSPSSYRERGENVSGEGTRRRRKPIN